jgi:TPR repeat protein
MGDADGKGGRPEDLASARTRYISGESDVRLPEPGEVVASRFTIEELIGRGGAGAVFRASDGVTRRTVALKLIVAERLARPGAREALIAEAVTARDIRHPSVIAVYDVGEWDGRPFITMELLPGRSLRAAIREQLRADRDWPMDVAAQVVRSALDGLEAAHGQGVIHRDLKPENIFLTAEAGAAKAPLKIIDFGIARSLQGGATDTGGSIGTPLYMAPEERTSPDTVNASADLYSLSVVFYELLAGTPPQGYWQPPSKGRSDVPPGIDALIEAGLSTNRRGRPQSVADYRKRLDEALAGASPKAETKSGPKPEPKAAKPPPVQAADDEGPTPEETREAADKVLRETNGDEKHIVLARTLYLDAAMAGDGIAMASYAYMASLGYGGPADMDDALIWFDRAGETGIDQAEAVARLSAWLTGRAKEHPAGKSPPVTGEPASQKPRPRKPAAPRAKAEEARLILDPKTGRIDVVATRRLAHRIVQQAGAKEAGFKAARELYIACADAGDPLSMAAAGFMISNGFGGAEDKARGDALMDKALDAGADVAEMLGRISEWMGRRPGAPLDERPDPPLVENLMSPEAKARRAAEGKALFERAGKLYRNGAGSAAELVEARKLYLQSAELGDSAGMTILGFMQANGMGGPKDEAAAREWTKKAADAGNGMAMNNLGIMMEQGLRGRMDASGAVYYYTKSAEAGSVDGMVSLGLALRFGMAGVKNEVAAREWFRRAAEKGDGRALFNLGVMRCEGWGGVKDEKAGREALKASAEKGHVLGMVQYGICLLQGVGGPKDAAQARVWTQKAAGLGDKDAAYNMGFMVSRGQGGAKDPAEARRWFLKAAESGQTQAQTSLAKMMLAGEGGAKDKPGALVWLRKAAEKTGAAADEAKELLQRNG